MLLKHLKSCLLSCPCKKLSEYFWNRWKKTCLFIASQVLPLLMLAGGEEGGPWRCRIPPLIFGKLEESLPNLPGCLNVRMCIAAGGDLQLAQFKTIACLLSTVPAALKGSSKQLEEVIAEALTSEGSPSLLRLAASHAAACLSAVAGDLFPPPQIPNVSFCVGLCSSNYILKCPENGDAYLS